MSLIGKIRTRLSENAAKQNTVYAVYRALVAEGRNPILYTDFAVPDTIDGRFDAIVLHLALFEAATRETLAGDPALKTLGADLIAVFLKDMDRNLRELGVGDLSVGRQVKNMASALYGRIAAYGQALRQKDAAAAVAAALTKNLYRGAQVPGAKAAGLCAYALKRFKGYSALDAAAIAAGKIAGRE